MYMTMHVMEIKYIPGKYYILLAAQWLWLVIILWKASYTYLTLMRKVLTIHKRISCALSESNFVGLSIVSRRIVAWVEHYIFLDISNPSIVLKSQLNSQPLPTSLNKTDYFSPMTSNCSLIIHLA